MDARTLLRVGVHRRRAGRRVLRHVRQQRAVDRVGRSSRDRHDPGAPGAAEQPLWDTGGQGDRAAVPAADGTQLDGVLVGSGPAGVVLLHQHPGDLCGFWPYAVFLSRRGLQALAIDLRCYGESPAPQADDAKSRVVDDVAGAVAALRAYGARRIALVGRTPQPARKASRSRTASR
jgi:hypothetical protein